VRANIRRAGIPHIDICQEIRHTQVRRPAGRPSKWNLDVPANESIRKFPYLTGLKTTFLMYDALFSYIEAKTSEALSDGEREAIMSAFDQKWLRKKQYFLQEGDVCKQIGFIVKGSARMFSVDERGHEHIIHFGLECWWISDPESFLRLTPSSYNIEMLEDSELLVIPVPKAFELRQKSRCFDLTVRALDQSAAIAMQKRIHAAIGMTAEERYFNLWGSYPQFLERFPMNMIASYLGVSPETLSRIRKHATRR
jgi:CRP-like cAMP-binding protein